MPTKVFFIIAGTIIGVGLLIYLLQWVDYTLWIISIF